MENSKIEFSIIFFIFQYGLAGMITIVQDNRKIK